MGKNTQEAQDPRLFYKFLQDNQEVQDDNGALYGSINDGNYAEAPQKLVRVLRETNQLEVCLVFPSGEIISPYSGRA